MSITLLERVAERPARQIENSLSVGLDLSPISIWTILSEDTFFFFSCESVHKRQREDRERKQTDEAGREGEVVRRLEERGDF